MIKKGDKRGLEMAINTIILMVLGIMILIALILIFNRSAGSFSDKINTFFSSSNVDNVIETCNNLVSQESSYDFCCTKKIIKLSRAQVLNMTCFDAINQTWGKNIQQLNCEGIC